MREIRVVRMRVLRSRVGIVVSRSSVCLKNNFEGLTKR